MKTTHYVTTLAPDVRSGASFAFNEDKSLEVVTHVDDKIATYTMPKATAVRFLDAIVSAHCAPSVNAYLEPYHEAIEVASLLTKTSLDTLLQEVSRVGMTLTLDEMRTTLYLALYRALAERWGTK